MKKLALALSFIAISSIALAKPLLIQDMPFCDAKPYIFYDMDGDGRVESICANPIGVKENNRHTNFKDIYIHEVGINFSSSQTFVIALKVRTQEYISTREYDAYIEPVNLNGYKHRLLKKKLSGMGVRKVYPEKSSVIYYWDKKKKSVGEFWESD